MLQFHGSIMIMVMIMTRARTSLPAFVSYLRLDCGVCLAWCVRERKIRTFPPLYRYSDVVLLAYPLCRQFVLWQQAIKRQQSPHSNNDDQDTLASSTSDCWGDTSFPPNFYLRDHTVVSLDVCTFFFNFEELSE